jgi:hypothetical protein
VEALGEALRGDCKRAGRFRFPAFISGRKCQANTR